MTTTCPVPSCGGRNFKTIQRLCTHMVAYHDGKMGTPILCGINNCQRTFHNVHTWKSHIRRTEDHRKALNMDKPNPLNPPAAGIHQMQRNNNDYAHTHDDDDGDKDALPESQKVYQFSIHLS